RRIEARGRKVMYTIGQWLHQHDLLLLVTFLLGTGFGLILWLRRRSVRWWAAWGVGVALSASVLLAMRTPAVSLTEHASPDAASDLLTDPAAATLAIQDLSLSSVEE